MAKDIYEQIAEKYRQKTGKELDEAKFTDKLVDIFIKLENDEDLESKLSDISSMTDAEIIKELTSSSEYVNHLYGYARGRFERLDVRGDTSFIENYIDFKDYAGLKFEAEMPEEIDALVAKGIFPSRAGDFNTFRRNRRWLTREEVWDPRSIAPQFAAKIYGFNLLSGVYIFQMWYEDKNFYGRPGCYNTYSLILPKDKKNEIVPRIKKNPQLLIDCFKSIYGQFDNSEGTLRLDPDFKPLIQDAEEN
jgi:hypothetical protein